MKITYTIEINSDIVSDTRDLALAIMSVAADIDHGSSMDEEEYGNVRIFGHIVGSVTTSAKN